MRRRHPVSTAPSLRRPLSSDEVTSPFRRFVERRSAFTLVELLVVIAIMVIMMALVGPVMNSLKGSRDVVHIASDIDSTLEQARAYAMANDTYVFVGFDEVDVTQPLSTNPTAPQPAGIGRIAMAIVASKDGTRIYDPNSNGTDIASFWSNSNNYANGAHLVAVGNLRVFDDVHLADSLGAVPTSGKMARSTVDNAERLGNSNCYSATPFAWPLGSSIGAGQYQFTKVIQFGPQGSAKVQTKSSTSNGQDIVPWVEVDLQQTHGNALVPLPSNPNTGTQTAIQIDGITGAVRTYTP